MKVVLLAAGRSFRMAPIADKNFLKFFSKPLLWHQLMALEMASCKEVLVLGGKHNIAKIKRLSVEFKIKITVREQKDLELGMAGAMLAAESFIKGDSFAVVSSNDIVDFEAVKRFFSHAAKKPTEGLLLAKKVNDYFPGGYLKINPKGIVTRIVEKPLPGKEPSKLVTIVFHYHPNSKMFFETLKKVAVSKIDDRYERAMQSVFESRTRGHAPQYRAMPFSGFWQPIKYPWHILSLMDYFLKSFIGYSRPRKNVVIAKSATISGDVYLAEGVRVLDNAVIQGPAYIGKNTMIATNALVRQSHIGENCVIGFGSEVARSYVGDNVWTHTNYIGDSIIGNDVSFGAGTVIGNLRLDEKSIKVKISKTWNGKVEETSVDSGLTKLGLITGDHIRVGINTSFMPGVKVGSNSFVGAGIVVAHDVPEGSFVRGKWELVAGSSCDTRLSLKVGPNNEKITPRQK